MEFIKFLWHISWKHILIASGAGLISGSGNALMISIINREVNQGQMENAAIFFICLGIFIVITSVVAQFLLVILSQSAIYELRLQLSKNILAAPLEHLERLQENRLIVMLTEDINILTRSVSAIPNIFIDLATVVGCFSYLAWLSGPIFAIAITSTLGTIGIVQTQLNRSQKLFFEAREEEDTLMKYFQGILKGIKELKLNRVKKIEFLEKNIKGSAAKLRRKHTSAAGSFILTNGFGQIVQFVCLGFILFTLPSLLQIPLPTLASYVLVSTFIALPMQNLLNRIPELVRGNVALQKIERMNLSLIDLAESGQTPAPTYANCLLQLRGLSYQYHPDLLPPELMEHRGELAPPHPPSIGSAQSPQTRERPHPPHPPHPPDAPAGDRPHPPHPHHLPRDLQGRRAHPPHPHDRLHPHPPLHDRALLPNADLEERGFILGPIDLTMQSGELIFIVGSNGSGKSTLAKLITGLYTPQSGSILINGEPIVADNIEWYRQHFATTFADIYLFDRYLGIEERKSNTAEPSQIDRQIAEYLREFQLDRKVTVNNGRLSTTSLSQGQRKRLALLTAFLEDRPIYLFDEWAADQDPAFREVFYKQMLIDLKKRGKLVIVITHDDRYFHLADRVLKLNYGRVELDEGGW
jgi:putative pyoverdin transport system ATP-binding/permease protein